MNKHSHRIQFLDFMRGFAVVFMVMGHSIDSVLTRQVRTSEWFILYDAIRGFTAPIFLFVSGYAFTIATEKRWNDFRTFSKPMMKRVMKIVLLFIIGYALHFPFFSYSKIIHDAQPWDYEAFFQSDVLQCVAASLLILQLLMFLLPNPRTFAVTVAGLAAGIVLSSPFVWSIDFAPIVSPVLSPYFNQTQLSIFPLFPFAAFLLAGVAVGHFFLEAKEQGTDQRFVKNLLVLAVVSIALGIDFDLQPFSLYPDHDFWKSSPDWFMIRMGIVALISVAFYYIRNLPPLVEKNLVALGQASLLIYPIHLLIVYGSAANYGLMQRVGQTLAAHQAVLVGVVVLILMLALTYVWNFVRKKYLVPARIIQAGLAGSLLYTFLTRPW